jgi:hypothetical protein
MNSATNSRVTLVAVLLTAGALVSATGLSAAPGGGAPSTTGLPPAASNAHRGGGYGGGGGAPVGSGAARDFRPGVPRVGEPFSGRPVPYRMDRDYGDSNTESSRIKQPYPYPYYSDTSRGNKGCHKYARRAIDTNNRNWWKRYQACIDVGGD